MNSNPKGSCVCVCVWKAIPFPPELNMHLSKFELAAGIQSRPEVLELALRQSAIVFMPV